MSAPEPTAVELTIAEVLREHYAFGAEYGSSDSAWVVIVCSCGTALAADDDMEASHAVHVAQAVVAAIRAMSPQRQAELIGGMTLTPTEPDEDGYRRTRVIGPWRLQS